MDSKELYWYRKNNGLCVACGKPAVPGIVRCEVCRERQRTTQKMRADYRRRNKVCIWCGKPAMIGSAYCEQHEWYHWERNNSEKKNTEQRMRSRARYLKLRSEGLCTVCGKVKTSKVRCSECTKKYIKSEAEKYRQRYQYRKENGLCVSCGKPLDDDGKVTCKSCQEKERKRRYAKKQRIHKSDERVPQTD